MFSIHMKELSVALTWDEITNNALAFSERWANGKDEKSEGQSFIRDFFKVFGVQDAAKVGRFEERTLRKSGKSGIGYIDYIWKGKIAIEMKSRGKCLDDALQQLEDYIILLPKDEIPNLLMTCDFSSILLKPRTSNIRTVFKTKDLHKHIYDFADIAGYEITRVFDNQLEVNIKAAENMAKLHGSLKSHGYDGHSLEVYLVRLLFCLFAEDTGIFPKDSFTNYILNSNADGTDLSFRIGKLFEILNLSDEQRHKRDLLTPELLKFRYVDGSLFQELLETAEFNQNMYQTLLYCTKFDWNTISPAIFGAMFQGVIDTKKRTEIGAHYTSEENILKVINPLFMDSLRFNLSM
jgi:hypothetical protein